MNIIRYHKEKEFNEIPKKNLMDFVTVHSGRDRGVIDTWERHFKSVNVPFGVESIGKELVLWKERRV